MLGSVVGVVGTLQATEVLKELVGRRLEPRRPAPHLRCACQPLRDADRGLGPREPAHRPQPDDQRLVDTCAGQDRPGLRGLAPCAQRRGHLRRHSGSHAIHQLHTKLVPCRIASACYGLAAGDDPDASARDCAAAGWAATRVRRHRLHGGRLLYGRRGSEPPRTRPKRRCLPIARSSSAGNARSSASARSCARRSRPSAPPRT